MCREWSRHRLSCSAALQRESGRLDDPRYLLVVLGNTIDGPGRGPRPSAFPRAGRSADLLPLLALVLALLVLCHAALLIWGLTAASVPIPTSSAAGERLTS